MSKISIVVPVYNVEQYLDKCINSILDQTFPDFTLILVDDGSTDRSGYLCDLAAEEDERIHVIHQKNGGAASARNAGIEWIFENMLSEWITFVDSDDWIHRRYLEILYDVAKRHSVSIAKCMYMPVENEVQDCSIPQYDSVVMPVEDGYLLPNSGVAPYAKLYKMESFVSIRYPEDKFAEDMFTTYRVLFLYEKIAVTNLPLYYYRHNPNSLTNSTWSLKQLDEFEAFEIQLEYFLNKGMIHLRNTLAGRYLWAIGRQYNAVKNSSMTPEKIRHYCRYLRKRMRIAIQKYAQKSKLPFGEYRWCYEIAYPKIMRGYWMCMGLLNKAGISAKR